MDEDDFVLIDYDSSDNDSDEDIIATLEKLSQQIVEELEETFQEIVRTLSSCHSNTMMINNNKCCKN